MPDATFTAVDLSRLPAPQVVEPLAFEDIVTAMLADLRARDPAFTATVESDPAYKLIEVFAYRELILRARVNDAARGVMTAYATGADLDNLAALLGVTRLLISPAVPASGTAAVYEADDDLRIRITLAPQGFSVAGPVGAYVFHALSADPRVLDASATSPSPGVVVVTVLARGGDGTAPPNLLAAVAATLNADNVRPLTDQVVVQGVTVVPFAISASVHTFAGPDSGVVLAAANASLTSALAANNRLGRDVTLSSLYAAIHIVGGVQGVTLASPTADLVIGTDQVAYCTGVTLTFAGTAD